MMKLMLKNKQKLAYGLILILIIIAIRMFENQIFYDPLIAYFKGNFQNTMLPKVTIIKLFFSLGFRYYLNSILSLALIYLIFKDTKMVKFSIFLYSLFGMILMIAFFFILHFFGNENKMNLFYIRRFIIQPIFLILFIPAFYYQKKMKKN